MVLTKWKEYINWCEQKKGSRHFSTILWGYDCSLSLESLTLLKVNLDSTVEAYKRQRKKKKEIWEKHIAEGVELFLGVW